ncbi:MAG: gamma-glutamyltransferase [Actinobacteria bacterium]|nr:gamma-glutamyltransferase [Actinomycetota bacterium]
MTGARGFTTRPEICGSFGMVASTHWLASATGMAVLEQGGNAFDAAVAAGFVLQVVEPHMNGLGGEVPIIGYSAEDAEVFVVNGQGPVPAAASIGAFEDLGLDLVPGSGLLAACVPGAFDAWMVLLDRWGSLALPEVLGYAIGYATNGFPLAHGTVEAVAEVESLFTDEWSDSAAIYLHQGLPSPGERFLNRALANTYERLVREATAGTEDRSGQIERARDCFYRGFVAEEIARYCAESKVMDSSGRRHRGLLTAGDMDVFEAQVEPPVTFDYHDYTVCKTGPWGQGPVLLQQLSLLRALDVGSMAPESAELIHVVTESAKLAFADREAWYGDPSFSDVPLPELLAEGYAAERRALIHDDASLELLPGSVAGREPRMPPWRDLGTASSAGEGTGEPLSALGVTPGDTCHLDIADRWGNLVSATPSGGWLQSSPVIPGLGFPLGTRAQMAWLTPGLPNSLAPGARPRTTLSPSFALGPAGERIAFGTPGGDQQDQWPLLFFLGHVHFGRNLQEAIDAPAWHSEHFPSSFYPRDARPGVLVVENRIPEDVREDLRGRGHVIEVSDAWSLGRTCAVAVDSKNGWLKGAANARGMQAYAQGR